MNPLVELQAYGQSFWYDNIQRKYLQDGTLQTLIDDDDLRGMTSNPSIFQKAIGGSNDYDQQMRQLVLDGVDAETIYEHLALADIQAACDLFADLYCETGKGDGFVSLEVSPHLAHDTAATVAEAQRLFKTVARPNVMIKVPATAEGIPAIRQLIGEGVNVNITLMFSMKHYEAVAQAYIDGLREWQEKGGELAEVASVSSFFVSRVDTAVDKQLAALGDPAAEKLMGKTAIANSKIVYQRFKTIFHGPSFHQLAEEGAAVQRILWASTSTKNPNYPETLYIDQLIGPETVNTIPPNTVDAFRRQGRVGLTLEENIEEAQATLDSLADLQIDLDSVTEQLQREGVISFANAFDMLLETIESRKSTFSET